MLCLVAFVSSVQQRMNQFCMHLRVDLKIAVTVRKNKGDHYKCNRGEFKSGQVAADIEDHHSSNLSMLSLVKDTMAGWLAATELLKLE